MSVYFGFPFKFFVKFCSHLFKFDTLTMFLFSFVFLLFKSDLSFMKFLFKMCLLTRELHTTLVRSYHWEIRGYLVNIVIINCNLFLQTFDPVLGHSTFLSKFLIEITFFFQSKNVRKKSFTNK